MVLFAEAPKDQMLIIKDCLDNLSRASGQRVSPNKSQIFFSKHMTTEEIKEITGIAGIPHTQDLGKYLGVPSIHRRMTNNMFGCILDRLDAKLEGWKTKLLTFAGRRVLAQSVLSTIPYYTMQTMMLPAGILEGIDKRVRGFIWGSTTENRRCHLVNWDQVTKPIELGGLGIKSARDMNEAFMAKLGWRLLIEGDNLWAKVLISKYARHRTGKDMFQSVKGSSNAWKGITHAMQLVNTGLSHKVNRGHETKFWLDTWVEEKPLIDFIQDMGECHNMHVSVADMWDETSGWKWNNLPNLPANIISRLHSMVLGTQSRMPDEVYWNQEPSGNFSITSAYNMIRGFNLQLQDNSWTIIWKLKVPNKVKILLWTMSHDKVLGNAERKRRGLTVDGNCLVCSGQEETTEHIFKTCTKATHVWNNIGGKVDTNTGGGVGSTQIFCKRETTTSRASFLPLLAGGSGGGEML